MCALVTGVQTCALPILLAAQAGGIGLVFGMTALSGVFGLVLSQVVGRLRKLFPPEVCGVVVLMIGLSIIRVALPLLFGMEQDETTIDRTALAVGLISLATMIAMTTVSTGHIRLYATIAGLLVGYFRSEERRDGNECGRTCKSGWTAYD